MATTQLVRANKRVFRKAVKAELSTISHSSIQNDSMAIAARIIASPFFQRSNIVSCYLNMPGGEVDTSEIVAEILRAGKTLFVPRIIDDRMHMLRIYTKDDLESLRGAKWGIKEPELYYHDLKRVDATDAAAPQLDLILTPGVAFDRSFSRLGHGKGFYDGFLTSYTTLGRKAPLLVALAFLEQLFTEGTVPVDTHDWKMNVIVTPDEMIERDNPEGSL